MTITESFRDPLPAVEVMDPPEEQARMMFDPSKIYYHGPTGVFLVDDGNYFRTYGRKSPVVAGVARYLRTQGADHKESISAAKDSLADVEIDGHVEWHGNLAGHKRGMFHSIDGKPMLILTNPSIPDSESGHAPTINKLIHQAFPDQIQRDIFVGWLAGGYKSVKAGVHQPAPMLCLAGPPNAGKSLMAYIVKSVLGGRSANPHNSWFGGLPWNDDLCGAELLLLDDCQGSHDGRARANFAAAFKEAVYSGDVQLRKRHASSMAVRPVWRVMICTNDGPENLLILPPITPDLEDKIILLKVERITPPIDTSHPDGRKLLQRMIDAELPMLAGYLERFQMPEALKDSRSGVLAWRHPDLVQSLESQKPEARLDELLRISFKGHLWPDLPRIMGASEIEGRLLDTGSSVRDQARSLFGTWACACGTYLGRLADGGSDIVTPAADDTHSKSRRFRVSHP